MNFFGLSKPYSREGETMVNINMIIARYSKVGSKIAKGPPLDLTQDTRHSYFEFIYLLPISFVTFV